MKLKELRQLFANSTDEEIDIDEIVKGNADISKMFEKTLTLDAVKDFVTNNEDGQKYLQSYGDKRVTDGIKTWQDKNLQTIINDEVLKATGKKKTPEQIQIEKLQKDFEEQKAKAERAETVAKYKDVLVEKKIPMEMIEYFLTDNEEITNTRIDNFTTYVEGMVSSGVKEQISAGNYTPPGENGAGELTANDIAKMMM